MEFKVEREYRSDDLYSKKFVSEEPFSIDEIIKLLKEYENDEYKLYRCIISTFSERGHGLFQRYNSAEELEKMHSLPHPSIKLHAIYIDRKTHRYEFEISTAANTTSFRYTISKELENSVNKEIELAEMKKDTTEKTAKIL